jgi:hypothetical protein
MAGRACRRARSARIATAPPGIRLTRLQDLLGHPGRIVRIGIECGVAADLAMRRDVRGDDRRAVGQRLGYGEPQTFGEGGWDYGRRMRVERLDLRLGQAF